MGHSGTACWPMSILVEQALQPRSALVVTARDPHETRGARPEICMSTDAVRDEYGIGATHRARQVGAKNQAGRRRSAPGGKRCSS